MRQKLYFQGIKKNQRKSNPAKLEISERNHPLRRKVLMLPTHCGIPNYTGAPEATRRPAAAGSHQTRKHGVLAGAGS
jgi:hypothetical protein